MKFTLKGSITSSGKPTIDWKIEGNDSDDADMVLEKEKYIKEKCTTLYKERLLESNQWR